MGGGNKQRSGNERRLGVFRSGQREENSRSGSTQALTAAIFNRLAGDWRIERDIRDARLGSGSFRGTAHFSPQEAGALLYEERGDLTLGDWRGPAWRRWVYSLEGDAIAIRYPGTLQELHLFRFAEDTTEGVAARHTHLCGEDRYEACMRCLSDGSLSLAYVVTGPAKDYRLNTLLTRL